MKLQQSTNQSKEYQKSLSKHGESPQSLKWASYKAATQRYKQIVADLDFEGKTVLDAGCGMGDLLPFMIAKTNKFKYVGADITPEFVKIAAKRYSGYNFEVRNPFENPSSERYDIVVSCGVMNSNTEGWQEERKQMIRQLYDSAKEAICFNMAGSMHPATEVKNIGYAYLPDILEFCTTLTHRFIVRNHYNTKDFTIILFK